MDLKFMDEKKTSSMKSYINNNNNNNNNKKNKEFCFIVCSQNMFVYLKSN